MQPVQTLGWRPALDGLRAIAVLAVIVFHYRTESWLPGGSFGVDIFFVLSGFLITTLIVEEWQRTGEFSMLRFLWRRFLRLGPAVLALLVVYTPVVVLLAGRAQVAYIDGGQALQNILGIVTLAYNWGQVTGQVMTGAYPHFWTLTVEAQFYLVWPLLLIAMLRRGASLRVLLTVCGALALLSAALAVVLSDQLWTRVYFATDTRAHQLLFGGFAAILFTHGKLGASTVRSPIFRCALAGSVAFLAWVMITRPEEYHYANSEWIFAAAALSATSLVVAATFSDAVPVMRPLTHPVMTWIGRRSYGIYLWHYPVAWLLFTLTPGVQLLVGCAITFALAEASYRWIEKPVLRWRQRKERLSTVALDATETAPLANAA